MNRIASIATAIVVLHLAVAIVHGQAHERLGVGLDMWQNVFVYTVIVAAPIVAAALSWTRWSKAGACLLGFSMLGSLAFGVYHHFIAVSSDHVGHLPEGDAQGLFVATAILLVPIEAAGAVFGLWSWHSLNPSDKAHASDSS